MTVEELVAQTIREVLAVHARNGEQYELIMACDELARVFGVDLEAIVRETIKDVGS